MKLYRKISPVLMFIGFASLAVGVFLSMSYYLQTAYALVVIGFILYVIGRIGIHFASSKIEKEENVSGEE